MLLAPSTRALALRPSQPTRKPLKARPAAPVVAAALSGAREAPPQHQQLAGAALGCLAALLLTASPGAAEAKEVIQGFPKVVDGDTLDFSGTRVRLFGIGACARAR